MSVERILGEFAFAGALRSWAPFGAGHINRTLHVRCAGGEYLVQRIAPGVFPDGEAVMRNLVRILAHRRDPGGPALVPLRDGGRWLRAGDGAVWRALTFVHGAVAVERAADAEQAHAAARAFAGFLAGLADLPQPALEVVIPGFHDVPTRLGQLVDISCRDPHGRRAEADGDLRGILALAGLATACSFIGGPRGLAHHDAKIGNLLFAADGRTAPRVVDLDTTMPGTPVADFADLVRTASCRAAEDGDPADMEPDPALLTALVDGWLAGRGSACGAEERALMPIAGAAMALEQAVRFLADHLAGDLYYRIAGPGHNLRRARAQLALCRALQRRSVDISRLVARKACA